MALIPGSGIQPSWPYDCSLSDATMQAVAKGKVRNRIMGWLLFQSFSAFRYNFGVKHLRHLVVVDVFQHLQGVIGCLREASDIV